MKTYRFFACLVVCLGTMPVHADVSAVFGSGPHQFTIDFVTIGNPGNPPYTTGSWAEAGVDVGAVGYAYQIGKYEVSRDMILRANAAGDLGITLADMTTRGGNGPHRPATGISWNEAARFVNWLNAECGFPPAYRFSLQPGDPGYDANANILLWPSRYAGYDAANPFRNRLAHYFLPSVDEWHKAAFYDPHANRGAGGYWTYPTGSDAAPVAVKEGQTSGTAVYERPQFDGPADVTAAGGLSPYGVMGLGGNVWEWEETEYDLVNDFFPSTAWRGVRGGGWWSWRTSNLAASSFHHLRNPLDGETGNPAGLEIGFRVASAIPEPSTALLILIVGLTMARRKARSI